MADESLNFKFSLDLSDFDKAPDKIASALASIKSDAEKNGKNVDLAMSGFLQSLIKEREDAIAKLSQELEQATKEVAVAFANMEAGVAGADKEYDKAWDNMNKLSKSVEQARGELQLLNEAEQEVADNASFLNQLKMKAQGMDLYGKAMSMLPAPIANVIQSTKGLNKALLALTTNPVVMMLAGLALAIKGLYGWFDGLADRSDGVAYAFGVVTGAVDKAISAFNELIHLNVEGFLYNIKTMFDGGEREVAKRNEDLRRVEEQGLRERLQRDNQFLRRRMSNTKLDIKDRLDAEKQYTENLKKIEETRRAELDRKMTEWSKKNGLRTKDNPNGWATDISQLSGPLQVELQEMYNEMARIDNAMADITEESKDRLVKMHEQQMELMKERLRYNRQVREQMEAEKERLRSLASQTENMVIQAQINEMADGLDKITKQAELKAKQAFESLEQTLRDEAQQLYNNEKSIFEGNPSNNGKIFKAFNLNDYINQAKKNIGYDSRFDIIQNARLQSIKKGTDEIVKNALDGAKKVAGEIDDVINRINDLSNADLPAVFGGEISLGFKEYIRDLERVDQLNAQAQQVTEELIDLEKERLTLEQKLTMAQTNDEKERISNKIKANTEATTIALNKAKKAEEDLKVATSNLNESYGKVLDTISMIEGAIGDISEQFKGLSEDGDKFIDQLQQMLSIVGKLASGDFIGAIVQVIVLMVQTTMDVIKSARESERQYNEWKQNMVNIYDSVAGAVYGYKQALIDAKYAEEELWSDTTISRMQKMIDKSAEAQKRLEDIQSVAWEQRKIEGVDESSEFYRQAIEAGAVARNGRKIKNSGYGFKEYDLYGSYYQTLETGKMNGQRGELLKAVLEKRDMEQIFNEYGDFNLRAYQQLKEKATEVWEGLAEVDRQQLDKIAEVAEEYEGYIEEMSEAMADWYAPLLDNMTDAWMEWLDTGEDVMDRFKDYSSDTFRDILRDILKQQLFQKVFSDFKDKATEMTAEFASGKMNSKTFASMLAQETQSMMNVMDEKSKVFAELIESVDKEFNKIGINLKESQDASGRTAEARGIARASQESVDENNARLAMMQQHTYSINANVAQLVSFSASALEHLSAIHSNTNRLERIEKSLANIETYGITTR